MTWLHRVKSSRVALRVPLLVALLMIIISAVISDQVLRRLSEMQERNLQGLVESYLDGVSASILPSIMRGDVWEVFDVLDRSASSYASLDLKETIVTGSDGSVIASNHPGNRPSFSQLPQEFLDQFRSRIVEVNQKTMEGFVRRDLLYQGQKVGTIFTILDVSHLMGERRNVLVTLLITNGVLACLFAAGGFWLVSYMIRPMRTLENHMRNSSGGMISLIDSSEIPKGDPEVSRLFHRFNELVQSEHEQREFARRLAEEEKLASLGRLSSSMAHEINNPLGWAVQRDRHAQDPWLETGRERNLACADRTRSNRDPGRGEGDAGHLQIRTVPDQAQPRRPQRHSNIGFAGTSAQTTGVGLGGRL